MLKNIKEKILGYFEEAHRHKHKFIYVETVAFEPLNDVYAKYTELWKCSCGERQFRDMVQYI